MKGLTFFRIALAIVFIAVAAITMMIVAGSRPSAPCSEEVNC